MTSLNLDVDSPAELVERMKSEFLAAQQRRRDRGRHSPTPPDDTDDLIVHEVANVVSAGAGAVCKPEPPE